MDESEARRILVTLRSELEEAHAAVQVAEKRAAAITKLVEGYVELFPGLGDHGPEGVVSQKNDRPRGQAAVRQVLTENPGKWFTVKLMTKELRNRGWLPDSDQPENAVRTALTRIAETDAQVRKGVGEKTRQITFAWFEERTSLVLGPLDDQQHGALSPWPNGHHGLLSTQEVDSS